MRAVYYAGSRFNLNRLSHQLMGLFHPEVTFRSIPIEQEVIIPDTSVYEGHIDVDEMVKVGAKGVIPKASQGIREDTQFKNTWTNAKGKLPRGCYHFFDPTVRPSLQVTEFVSLIKDDPGELPLVVDWEATWAGTYSGWKSLYDFLEGLKAALPGRKIIIYTGYYFWLDHSPNPITQAASLAYFTQYGLWLAWYTTDFSIIRIPRPWNNLTFLQYTESGDGVLYGAQSLGIDLSYYAGTEQQYIEEFNLGGVIPTPPPTPTPEPTPGGTMTSKVTVNVGAIANLKDIATGAVLHQATAGEVVYGILSTTGSDVIGFSHYYDAGGVQHPLSVSGASGAKVSIGSNVTKVDNVVEPSPTPTPTPPPTPTTVPHMKQTLTAPDGSVWLFECDGVKQ